MRQALHLRFLLFLLFSACTGAPNAPDASAGPESVVPEVQVWPHGAMVAVANPYAAEAAAAILRRGGHAVDAAIAAHAVLGLVEPQSSGLGGGAFMLVYERADDRVIAYDGRETAPHAATRTMFAPAGRPLSRLEAWQSGLSVGTPGIVALYELSHANHGRLPYAEVLGPAIELAQAGFEVSPRLAGFLERIAAFSRLDDNPASAAYFYPGGQPLAVGSLRRNPAYATTLTRVVQEGAAAFYTGEIAAEIVAAVGAKPNPGSLALRDLAAYEVKTAEALCVEVARQRFCTMPPPSSGLALIMTLGLYDRLIADKSPADAPQRLSAFVDALRLAYADRDHYVADPAFVAVPTGDLLNADYLDARFRQRFAPEVAPVPGDPGEVLRDAPVIQRWGRDTTAETPGTTHLSIVDLDGNAVAMTATVEGVFGSSRWVGGFLLNNEMTDFARQPKLHDKLVANTVAPGKRPRSSMSPLMVFDAAGELKMVTGSPGGNSIISYVAKTLVGSLRWGLSAQEAVNHPNIVARGLNVRVETGVANGPEIARMLAAQGYPVQEREGENSGLHVIMVGADGLEGAADPRREGVVISIDASGVSKNAASDVVSNIKR